MKVIKLIISAASLVMVSCLFTKIAQASLIDQNSYINHVNNEKYWTNNDLNLDIMRLSFSDLLNADGTSFGEQADVTTINEWLASQNQWRWARGSEFDDVYNWFDSDIDNQYWTGKQNIGSSLFFELNGTGPAFTDENFGYNADGYSSWVLLTESADMEKLQMHVMSDYCDTVAGCQVNIGEDRLNKGYHVFTTLTESSYHMHSIYANKAALLVRSIEVPEPSSFVIFFLSLLLFFPRLRRM